MKEQEFNESENTKKLKICAELISTQKYLKNRKVREEQIEENSKELDNNKYRTSENENCLSTKTIVEKTVSFNVGEKRRDIDERTGMEKSEERMNCSGVKEDNKKGLLPSLSRSKVSSSNFLNPALNQYRSHTRHLSYHHPTPHSNVRLFSF